VITLVAGIIGTILGVLAVEVLLPMAGSSLTPIYSIETFVKAFAIAITVGVVGGIYPALKAVRLAPTEALRYE
jgi:putative ABC transport system permease protein